MINGLPVTFEWTDQGTMYELGEHGEDGFVSDKVFASRWRHIRKCLVVDMVGEGFWVRSAVPWTDNAELRSALDRSHLERHGVDTSTVEYLEGYVQHRLDPRAPSDLRYVWWPLFPKPPGFKVRREGDLIGEFSARDDAIDAAIMAIRTGARRVEIESQWDARKP
jgi:hypothetical protein